MRLILFFLLVIFIYWFVKNVFWPALKAYLIIKRSQKHFHRDNTTQKHHSRPEGHVEVKNPPGKSFKRQKKENNKGEYIEYEDL